MDPAQLASIAFVEQNELRDGELLLELSSYARHPYHQAPTYSFRMIHAESGAHMGGIRLRVGSTAHVERYAGHIGYDVREAHRGHHYAARAVRLLVPLARRVGLDPLWITCDPENMASRRSIELAGGRFVEVVEVPADCAIRQSGHPLKCRFRI
ncbi:MAG: GNAT family N-acetyltransferase [Acidobacteriaceae bacterium]|nr:GNAT family N-acetyltransferase [Acidobacteriaceae bacterium]